MCVDCVANDKSTLLACSQTSLAVRRLCYKHLFREIHYVSGVPRGYKLTHLLQDLDKIPHLCGYVRRFVIAPRQSYWGLLTEAKMSPCILWGIISHFPRLTTIILHSFTLVGCSHDGPCISCPMLPDCRSVDICRVLVTPVCDLDSLADCFLPATTLSIRYIHFVRPFPAITTLHLPSQHLRKLVLDLPLHSKNIPQKILDAPWNPKHSELWYNLWNALQNTLRSTYALEDLRITWVMSFSHRGKDFARLG